jgi:ParB family chromosome partitioning protein
MAGLTTIPIIVMDIDFRDALEIALIENVQRQDLTPIEEAEGYKDLMESYAYTQEDLSNTIGKSRSHIANLLILIIFPLSEYRSYI